VVGKVAKLYRRIGEKGPSNVPECLLFCVLFPLGILYGLISKLRVLFYRIGIFETFRADVPVISVGNLSVGGTGKTPVVDYIVRDLILKGHKVAVVSRGYGGEATYAPIVVRCGGDILVSPHVCGDEPYLLARRNPDAIVIVSRRRREGVLLATRDYGADVVILDDGFQHLAVRRNLDIVLLDSRRPFGNGHVLPAGILREFISALKRADILLLTRDAGNLPNLDFDKPIFRSRHLLSANIRSLSGAVDSIERLSSSKCFAFAGIASPESFFDNIRSLGINLTVTMALPDHVRYDAETVAGLAAAAQGCDFMVTTEKDGVKLTDVVFNVPCYEIPVEIEFLDESGFAAVIEKVIE